MPAPLQSTEYQSDDSSASNHSNPRSSRPRFRTGPATGDSTTSPAKMGPHKKHVDSSGQTLLARACSNGKFDVAKSRLEERPEDLEHTDNAGNRPLHFASINGHEAIVKLLLDNKCTLDVVNFDGDTPLHDAIENGHVEVVRMLLEAGANPRKANKKGDEPLELLERISRDTEESAVAEMRQCIEAAKMKSTEVPRSHQTEQTHDSNDGRSQQKANPRYTPPIENHNTGRGGRATARSTKTSDSILYESYTIEKLREACSEGNMMYVSKYMDINEHAKDPECLNIAAKSGHEDIVGLLLALMLVNPDPNPPKEGKVEDSVYQSSTPMLAAIGRENTKVIKLLLAQDNFKPTRLIQGLTYYEIAQKRGGPMWKEEYEILKEAYDKDGAKKSPPKSRSPKVVRDADREARRPGRNDRDFPSQNRKRSTSGSTEKDLDSRAGQRKSNSALNHNQDNQEVQDKYRRGPGRPRKEESTTSIASSDLETTPLGPPKRKKLLKKSDSEIAVVSSDSEKVKPRRKLLSGKELKEERENQRRASFASTASNVSLKEKRGSDETKSNDSAARRSSAALSRDSSGQVTKNSKSVHHDNELMSTKSEKSTNDRARSLKRDPSNDRVAAIRNEKSPIKRQRKSTTPPRTSMQESMTLLDAGGAAAKRRKLDKHAQKESSMSSSPPDQRSTSARTTAPHDKPAKLIDNATSENRQQNAAKVAELNEARLRSELEEKEAKRKRDEEEKLEAERKDQAKREREAQERLALEEAARIKQEEDARIKQEEEDRKARQLQADREALDKLEEQKRLYNEQKRIEREKHEQRVAEARAEKARIAEKQNQERLERLPLLLRWFDMCPNPKTTEIASQFSAIQGYRYDTINPEANGQPHGREQWLLNSDVALLLGEKDLQLSRCKCLELHGREETNTV